MANIFEVKFESKVNLFKEDDKSKFYITNLLQEEHDDLDNLLIRYNKLTKEAKNEFDTLFYKLYGFYPNDIIGYGDTVEVPIGMMELLIGMKIKRHKTFHNGSDKEGYYEEKREYDCFDVHPISPDKPLHKGNTVVHEDIRSAWKCLMNRYKHKDNILIFKIDK